MGLAVHLYLDFIKEKEWNKLRQAANRSLSHLADIRGDTNPLAYEYEKQEANAGRRACCNHATSQRDTTKAKCGKHNSPPCNWFSFRQQDNWPETVAKMARFMEVHADEGLLAAYEWVEKPTETGEATLKALAQVTIEITGDMSAENGTLQDDDDALLEDRIFEVEDVVDSEKRGRVMWYEISWKEYTSEENTWEPWTNLRDSVDLVQKYHQKHPDRERARLVG